MVEIFRKRKELRESLRSQIEERKKVSRARADESLLVARELLEHPAGTNALYRSERVKMYRTCTNCSRRFPCPVHMA